MNNYDVILRSLDVIVESRIWKDRPPSHAFRILLYMNKKGWLYTPEENGEVKAVIGAYRVPDTKEETLGKLPVAEKGNILYIPFVISLNKEDNIYKVVREAANTYLKENQDIVEIALEGKDDKLRRYKIGVKNGKVKKP